MVNKVLIDVESEADRIQSDALIPERFDHNDIMSPPGSHVSNLLPVP